MHEARVKELPHPGVDDRIAGSALLPGFEGPLGRIAGVDLDGIEVPVPIAPCAVRPAVQHGTVEVAEGEFTQVSGRSRITECQVCGHRSRMDGPEFEVGGHSAGGVAIRSVPLLGVGRQIAVRELRPLSQRGALTGFDVECDTGIGRIDPTNFV